ncbi:hypothetical protein Tco_0598580 [Tanacetum coccineum]
MNPEILVKVVQEQMQKEFYVGVSKTKAFRAKAKAQLQRCNPDTIVKIDVYREEDPYKTTRMFRIIYVCLGALKMGFKEDGRDLLGLDGAFMRGQYPGQMLKVVGVDANNRIYPGMLLIIAKLFPVVEHRTKVEPEFPHIEATYTLAKVGVDPFLTDLT